MNNPPIPTAPKAPVGSLAALGMYLRPHKGLISIALLAVLTASGSVLLLGQGMRYLVDEGFVAGNTALLNQAALVLAGLLVLLSLASFARYYSVTLLGEKVTASLRRDVFANLLTLSPMFYERNKTGELTARLTADTTMIQTVVASAIPIAARNTVLFSGGALMLITASPKLALLVGLGVPLVLLPIALFSRKVRMASRTAQDAVAGAGAYLQETLEAIRTVQANSHEPHDTAAFSRYIMQAYHAAKQRNLYRGLMSSIVIALVFGAITAVLWIGGHDVLAGRLSSGELVGFIFYAVLVASSSNALSDIWGELQKAAGAAERLLELRDMPTGLQSASISPDLPARSRGDITFNNVGFCYPLAPETPVLQNFSLSIAAGETIAFVGSSGAGKSTLFQLLLRYYDCQKGSIHIDGIPLPAWPLPQLRQQFAVVPQEPFIFAASARDNICYGAPDADETAIIAAATAAGADIFIQALPQGYATVLGEKGVELSGGQKQRLALARAFLRQAPILLLDEATSALDGLSEHHVQQALRQRGKQATLLVIAHRLATVIDADRIVVLEAGRIAAIGTHTTLLNTSPLYRALAETQLRTAS